MKKISFREAETSVRKLLDSLENAQKAWVDLKKDAKGTHKLFKDYQRRRIWLNGRRSSTRAL